MLADGRGARADLSQGGRAAEIEVFEDGKAGGVWDVMMTTAAAGGTDAELGEALEALGATSILTHGPSGGDTL